MPLPGGDRPTQSDLWVLARGADAGLSISVEGKKSEPFGPTVGEWLKGASEGKLERLRYLRDVLGLQIRCAKTFGTSFCTAPRRQ